MSEEIARPSGYFIVDLRGLELSGEQAASIEVAIQEAVQKAVAEIDDLEGPGLAALGGGLAGFVAV